MADYRAYILDTEVEGYEIDLETAIGLPLMVDGLFAIDRAMLNKVVAQSYRFAGDKPEEILAQAQSLCKVVLNLAELELNGENALLIVLFSVHPQDATTFKIVCRAYHVENGGINVLEDAAVADS